MMADTIAWLATEAGLPMLEEDDGELCANAAARDAAGDATDLALALARLTQRPSGDPPLQEVVRRARAGLRTSAPLGDWVAVSAPRSARSARLVLVPRRASDGSAAAASIAHELSNALGAIVGWSELARRRGEPDDITADALERIERSARTARATAQHLLESAKGGVAAAEPVCVATLARDIAGLLEPVAAEAGVRIEAPCEGPLVIDAARAQLSTILWNLLQNAIEASPRGGVVAIETRRRRGRVRIEVADQGPGIAEADRARIFDPYFTTKPAGTGLGLALVRQAVESLGGTLAVRSQPGHGARFCVELGAGASALPIAPPPHEQSGVRARRASLPLRVLVVEDDRAMRELMATTLELHGATVVAAATGAEALAAGGPFDIALLDFGLDVRGDHLLAELRRRGTVDTAALVSGSAPPADLAPAGRPEVWMRKPFELEELVDAVARLRSGARSGEG